MYAIEFSVEKADCPRNASKSVIHKSVFVNLSKRARKQSFNVSSQKLGVTKSFNVRSVLMTSIYFYGLVLLFLIFQRNFSNGHVDNFLKGCVSRISFSRNEFLDYDSFIYHNVNIFNISHTNVLSSSSRFYLFSFYFCKYSFFNDIIHVNNITNIFDNNLYVTDLLNRNNKFLYCNCKVTGESNHIISTRKKIQSKQKYQKITPFFL